MLYLPHTNVFDKACSNSTLFLQDISLHACKYSATTLVVVTDRQRSRNSISYPCFCRVSRKSGTISILQSVSANFTRSSSELYSEIDKWAGNFVITFRNSEAIFELRFEIRKFKLRVYVPRNIKDVGEKT